MIVVNIFDYQILNSTVAIGVVYQMKIIIWNGFLSITWFYKRVYHHCLISINAGCNLRNKNIEYIRYINDDIEPNTNIGYKNKIPKQIIN